jgi:transposase
MPRRSPGEIRTASSRRRGAGSRQAIPGLSTATNRQIAQFEVQHRLPPGHVAHAFRAWALAHRRWPDHGPNHGRGTTLWRDMHARTLLQGVASTMTRKARRQLLGAVAPLDDRFLRRTLPDPFSLPTDPWWKRRLVE